MLCLILLPLLGNIISHMSGVGASTTMCRESNLGQEYNGQVNTTRTNKNCVRWAGLGLSFGVADFPDDSIEAALNYCRNPDGRRWGPWCRLEDGTTEYCLIPFCKVYKSCLRGAGYTYVGTKSVDRNGGACTSWDAGGGRDDDQYENPERFPDSTVADASNYCRNPFDGPVTKTFCINSLTTVSQWNYCDVPTCAADHCSDPPACPEGQQISQWPSTCESDGTWTTTCSPVNCGNPPEVANASVQYSSTEYSSVATYTCDFGHFNSGTNTVMCLASGSWSNPNLACQARQFEALEGVPPGMTHSVHATSLVLDGNNETCLYTTHSLQILAMEEVSGRNNDNDFLLVGRNLECGSPGLVVAVPPVTTCSTNTFQQCNLEAVEEGHVCKANCRQMNVKQVYILLQRTWQDTNLQLCSVW